MTVDLMSGKYHASIKALEGYCWFHRIFFELVNNSPYLLSRVDQKIKDFIDSPKGRHKDAVPSLGEFLPLLTVSEKYSWRDVGLQYIDEAFTRNAKWIVMKYPELHGNTVSPSERVAKSFAATEVGLKLLLFNHYFLTQIARPAGKTLREVMHDYDSNFGSVSTQKKELFQQVVFKINSVNSYNQIFVSVGMKAVTERTMNNTLLEAKTTSERLGYHYSKSRYSNDNRGFRNYNNAPGRGYGSNNYRAYGSNYRGRRDYY
eukprot:CAMPEP_0174279236 /NCGR_PEP_ID=MMETSP0439-20130205/61924_1 /TAXON_ID=0 /ORGANISM="Stereomyxa ramosa, Strain Chinc5" /LENGTH=259 /DNA_ID=CAMNT_0015371739 /DNA_START=1202 /DNA_END=1981 /DNA_ORIENTATION=+